MKTIRELFSTRRPIDRPIEKVIDYYAADEKRLAAEIEEYEVTDNVEACFGKFLDVYGEGVRTGQVTEIGIWVSGFYGSGKSSFTKYLGFALDPERVIAGRPFLDLLGDRLNSAPLRAELRTVASKHPTAVVMLDLGAEQLADTASAPVSTVLYWKVLQWAGYSKEKKLAQLELTLDKRGLTDRFREAYRKKFADEWEKIHNDPLIGVARAAQIVPDLLPGDFPTAEAFSRLRFDEALDVRARAAEMIELVRKRTGRENILFLIDETGQYVAPRGELILNLDGLARNLKELGQGKVWIVATGQQTLAEIIEKAAHNSAELNKLRDRFPIAIDLDARDIREITYRRLLTKSPEGERTLKELFAKHGQKLLNDTRLQGTVLFKGDPDGDTFVRLYPFLPQHFDLLLELIRTLARSTGGIGLRSAIRVIQDLLIDASKVLPAGAEKIADRKIGRLACADDFYETLRADIAKVLPHVVSGVERVAKAFPKDTLALRVAKAIAALQAVDGFPKTAENIAALLYRELGAPSLENDVREALRKLIAEKECSVIEDPQAGGFLFLSEGVKPLRDKRNAYVPTAAEINQVRSKLLDAIFDPPPAARLENVKEVKAGVRYGRVPIVNDDAEIQFRIEAVEPATFDSRRTALLTETHTLPEYKNTVAWLIPVPGDLDDDLVDACRSEMIIQNTSEREADRDVAQFLRAERRNAEKARDRAQKALSAALLEGTFIFTGRPRPVKEAALTVDAAARTQLGEVAKEVFPQYRLAPIRPSTDLAAKFLAVERLDRMPRDLDPLGFVVTKAGSPRIDLNNRALAEALRVFQQRADESGTGRLQGNALQDCFSGPPYGWSKDATRYVFAALFVAGEIELHTPGGLVKTSGPLAVEAMKSTVAFNRVGVSRRDSRPPMEALDRTATNLQQMFGDEVLPLEDHISKAVRKHVPGLIEKIGSLPDRLRLLGLAGEDRAARLLQTAADLLKQDGGGATGVLGTVNCTLPSDTNWARSVSDALASGAETEVRLAREIERGLSELSELFPGSGPSLLPPEQATAIQEALGSENFHEHLTALRTAIRSTLDRVRSEYQARRVRFDQAVREAVNALEAMPEWTRITPEDQEEIAARFESDSLPTAPTERREVIDFRRLLAREAGLTALRAEAAEEVRRRVPPPPISPEMEAESREEIFDLNELVPPNVIATVADLDSWLSLIRDRLEGLLRRGRKVRLR
jgi:hypothetical protein